MPLASLAPHLEVVEFSEASLRAALANGHCKPAQVESRPISGYLYRYLSELGAKTLVVESSYVDGDYLDDYAAYYSRCFKPYERHCKRLHFFQRLFDEGALAAWIENGAADTDLNADYLGFVVARPLPETIVGRTVLRTYPEEDDGHRSYRAVHEYKANLAGIELTINSLPFQEQDTVLAACATVSLWSSFHQTASLFQTPAPRPAAITGAANNAIIYSRPIPSRGLVVEQICHAIRSVGLEPEVVQVTGKVPVPSLMYAYLSAGIPVILGVKVEGRGLHALAVAGYAIAAGRHLTTEVVGAQGAPMTGLRISKFYAHDDQVGPFSRIMVNPSVVSGAKAYPVMFDGSWRDKDTQKWLQLLPEVLIIPVYHKIRVTFLDVQTWLVRLHALIKVIVPSEAELEWDVRLTTANDYKVRLRARKHDAVGPLLARPHPRFIWSVEVRYKGAALMELLADATGMARSFPFYQIIWRRKALRDQVTKLLTTAAPPLKDALDKVLTPPLVDFLKSNEAIDVL